MPTPDQNKESRASCLDRRTARNLRVEAIIPAVAARDVDMCSRASMVKASGGSRWFNNLLRFVHHDLQRYVTAKRYLPTVDFDGDDARFDSIGHHFAAGAQ